MSFQFITCQRCGKTVEKKADCTSFDELFFCDSKCLTEWYNESMKEDALQGTFETDEDNDFSAT